MSSMIKKKGALSFKPKAPIRRAAGASQSRNTSSRPSIETSVEPPSVIRQLATTSPLPDYSHPTESVASLTTAEEVPRETQTEASVESVTPGIPSLDVPTSPTTDAALPELIERQDASIQITENSTVPTLQDETTQGNLQEQNAAAATVPEQHVYLDDMIGSTDVTESVYPPLPGVGGIPAVEGTSLVEGTLGAIGFDLSALGAGQSNRATQIVPFAPLNPDGTSGDPISHPQAGGKPAKKRRRIENKGGEGRPGIEVQIHKARRGPAKNPRPPRNPNEPAPKRKNRAETPEDAEKREVDHSTLKMADLCKDLKIGRNFSKHDEIVKRENDRRIKAKFLRQNPELADEEANANQLAQEAEEALTTGPQMRIVDGQIVIDDASLVVDRHRAAAATTADMEVVEEDDFSKVTTSGTHMRRENNLLWSYSETEKFYHGLRMLGTNFEMIAPMFPSRNRRQVKLKFNKEERENPKKINKALIEEQIPFDLQEYQSYTGLQYEDVSTIQEEQDRIEEEHSAEQRRLEEAAAETTRQKKAEIQNQASLAPRAAVETTASTGTVAAAGTESAKENEGVVEGAIGRAVVGRAKKKVATKKKKRSLHANRGGGEEVEVLGRIDGV